MSKEYKNLIRQCNKKKVNYAKPLLEKIVRTHMTEELFDMYDLPKKKRDYLRTLLSEQAKSDGVEESKKYLEPAYLKVPKFNESHKELRELTQKVPTNSMSKFLEIRVRKTIRAKKLEKIYPEIINKIIEEAKDIYLEVTHLAGVNLKTKPVDPNESRYKISAYKHFGRTKNYEKYLVNRKKINGNWLLAYPLIKTVLAQCVVLLPPKLFDISVFHSGLNDLYDLKIKFDEYIEQAFRYLQSFQTKMIDLIESDKSKIKRKHFTAYYSAISKLIALHVRKCIYGTLDHIIEVAGSNIYVPFLLLSLSFENRLVLKPSPEDTIKVYSALMERLVKIGEIFRVTKKNRQGLFEEETIILNITERDLQESIKKMFNNVFKLYDPVIRYIAQLDSQFCDIYDDIKVGNKTEEDMSFYDGISLIEHYKEYLEKATEIECTEYFSIGQLAIAEYVLSLKDSLSLVIEDIFIKLCAQHQWENDDICENFKIIEAKALQVPTSTEQLIEQGKYMLEVKGVLLKDLTERIQTMLNNLSKLISIGNLTKEHMELNVITVQWLRKIDVVIDKNSSVFEQLKYEAEEKLHQTQEEIKSRIDILNPLLEQLNDMDDVQNSKDYLRKLSSILVELRNLKEKIDWIHEQEYYLGFKPSVFKEYDELCNFIYPFYHLVYLCTNLLRKITVWLDGQFEFLVFEEAEMFLEECNREFLKQAKAYKNEIRQRTMDKNPFNFKGLVEDVEELNLPAPMKLAYQAIALIKSFRPAMNMMRIMCNPSLMTRHWKEMSEVAGFDLTPNAGTSLRKMMQMGLEKNIDQYDVTSASATKERELLNNLTKMQNEWKEIMFKMSTYKETGIPIVTALDDIQVVLDDHIIKTLTMRGSVFVKPYEKEVLAFYTKIIRINKTLDELGKVQAQWLYLLPIFSSKDIVTQMPEEGVLFREVNDTYRRYMDTVSREPKVFDSAGATGIYEMMVHCLELLEQINEGVASYLEKKRLFFPRFFFLSNDEMLEILSETKDPLKVQPHLKKCFEAIDKLYFDNQLIIHEIISQEGERLELKNTISPKEAGGSVEKWLIQVEDQMVVTMSDLIVKSNKNYLMLPRTQWVTKWQGQIVLAVSQIHWTRNVHNALNKFEGLDIEMFFEMLKTQLQAIVAVIRDPSLTYLSRITIKALIVIDVHAKDVVQELYESNVQNDKEFKWLSQLRYYLEDESCLVRLINATVKYAYEYLGNTDRLVITPLTDRCYRTLIGAYHLHLNGAPEGPAGTGKTETTKDLAKALAVQCVVFNCSDGLDYKAMGKFFKGLASCGAWVCFDEFNRIDIEVLSVVAQQILSVVMAVRANVKTFIFEGTELKLNPTCYVCITMNPGYAGRSELPDNLKVLFRTVAMMVPDYAMIGEISLYSFGFIDARNLSVKIVTVYRLCSEQLSSQNHYDYGMRAVKSVLSAAGNHKRNFPNQKESILLLRAIIDVNLPKFLSHDLPLFSGIISDLFPGITLPKADYKVFTAAIKKCSNLRSLQPKESFIEKIIQTYEMMIVRHGFMIVGDPFAGKTSTLKVLADTLTLLSQENNNQLAVKYQFLNPKAITMGQLYGCFDPVSYEWSDGVVANIYRGYTVDTSPDRKWIIFDGPVDAVWIENMNSALDDNKKLCLMSGEVMQMTSSMSLIFEVKDLEQASPATVSRCGMIYMEPVTLGWEALMESWLPTLNSEWVGERKSYIRDFFKWLVPPLLTFLRKNCIQYCVPGDITLVKNSMILFQIYMDDAYKGIKKREEEMKLLHLWIQAAMVESMVWGIGGILDSNSRQKYDIYLKGILSGEDQQNPIPENIDQINIIIPTENLIANYYFHYRSKGYWKHCPDLVKSERVDEAHNLQQVLVPTVDTIRYVRLINKFIKNNQKFLIVGPTGTGKSFYIQDILLNKLDKELYEPGFITFTVKISANQTQDLVISKLNKKRRGVYGPPKGKLAVIFIDDVNMPEKEKYGAQPPIELLRQHFDHSNWFDLKTTESICVNDTLFAAAMGLVGGSRQEVYARFLRHFIILSINEFSTESLAKIYSNVLLLGWKNNGFPSDVITFVNLTVTAGLNMFKSASENLRPTPSKSHYVFNLRDFSRLIFGCALLRKESVSDEEGKKVFPKIFVHEVLRVFYDRLIDQNDKDWIYEKIKSLVKDIFRESFDSVFDNLPKDANGTISQQSLQNLMFGSYFDLDSSENERRYEECKNAKAFLELSENCLDEYNSTHKSKMDIVLFDYALEHLSRICRVLTMSAGSCLLVGISGSGRQSLTKLASELYSMKLYQPEITKNYSLNEWRDDIKKVLKESGGLGRHCTFLISEGQIKEELFLQDIDCLLNSGEVPNIYQIDEKQEILDMVRLAAQGGNRNLDISPLTVFFYFTRRCKECLHIILCFSPVGSNFRNRLRLFPALINCCTINWFHEWPATALEEVAVNWMEEVNLSESVKLSAISACKHFHMETRKLSMEFLQRYARQTYITTASYLELIKSFTVLTNSKQDEIMKAKGRYIGGLEKLQFAAASIEQMQIALAELQPQLKSMSEKATEMTLKIEKETVIVENAALLVRKDERVANRQAASAQALKKECEADLAEAMPILNEALSALDTLKPADISLVKSMKNPPDAVKLVIAAVCILKDIKPDRKPDPSTGKMTFDYWGPSKKMLGDMNFLQGLKDYDKDNIKPDVMLKIRKEFLPHKDFRPEVVAKASSAAEGICKWIIAMDKYDDVIKIVAPKREKLFKAESEFAQTMAILEEKRTQLKKLEDDLAELNEKLDDAIAKQTELQNNVNLCNDKLVRAKKLIGGLGGEKTRWTEAAQMLQSKYDGLAGDILLSCAIIAYLSPFDALFRTDAISKWHSHVRNLHIPCAKEFDLATVIGSDVLIQNWNIYGLPRDTFSIENGIIQHTSRRFSLFIDPQSQASNWIKKMEKKNNLEVVKFAYADYMKKIEMAVQLGYPVLIESVEESLEAPLDPLLYKTSFKQAGREVISIGENVIEYNKNFKLYMCSKLRNPHYLPEIFNKVTIINFALTLEGLQDQLLGIVVAVEKPELQQLKEELIVQKAENRAALLQVEENILRTLAETKGDILEDEKAIQVLDESKLLSIEINEKQTKSLEIETSLEEFRVKYQNVAEHAAVLYYCISDLANVDPMYQYSLEWFINLYISSIQKAENFRLIEKRVKSLINAFTYDLYSNITRSLFEKDKMLFSFLLCCKIMIHSKKLLTNEFIFLLTGGIAIKNDYENPSKWLPLNQWDELCRIGLNLDQFKMLREDFTMNHTLWRNVYDNDQPQTCIFPGEWQSNLKSFDRLLVIRIIRPDKILEAIAFFIKTELGERFIQPPQFNIALSYSESYSLCPLIFILSPGVDPMSALVKFTKEQKIEEKFASISLGQGQGPIAQALIETAMAEGGWVCLQNCHLATSWMPTLEKIFESLDFNNTHDMFRLWLTSYPSDKFPVTILQKGVKMTNEPPSGLQQNLLKSYINDPVKNEDFFEGCPNHEQQFKRLLYGVAFFHAVIQERRTFGALGWNIPYGFNDSDFDISVQQLKIFINESDDPYEALTYLIGECNYGGRVTDDWDRRLIVTILQDFLNPEMVDNLDYKFIDIADYYGLPNESNYEDYVHFIKQLPAMHPPEVFGLHKNAGITRDLQNSQILLNSVLKAFGEIQGGGAIDTDTYLMNLTNDILDKLPPLYDLDIAKEKYPVQYSESMNTVLVQEMERFNKLLTRIRSTLQTMQKAIKGLVAMSPELDRFSNSLILARIPDTWMEVSYPSLKNLSNYVTDFILRLDFLSTWFDQGKPDSYWISGFFFTQAFLTGVKQNFARKYTIPIDKLTFDFQVLDFNKVKEAPNDGAYVYGLFTDGARWDTTNGVLAELYPKILNEDMPPIWVIPTRVEKLEMGVRYTCPVYKTSSRRGVLSTTGHSTNYVLPILLNTTHSIAHWIKRSVALLCQLD